MRTRFCVALTAVIFAAWAAAPKAAPDDYPVHADSAQAGIGVEYLVHSVPTENGMLMASRYLVVEAGIFPHAHEEVGLAAQQFHLIVNGKALPDPDTPGTVAASMKYSNWDQQRGLQTAGTAGPVVIGPQQPAGRFPGDPTAPGPVQQPTPQENPTGTPPNQMTVDELVLHAALPIVAIRKPINGCLFFQYDGKPAKIRTLELVWEAPNAPPVNLKLR